MAESPVKFSAELKALAKQQEDYARKTTEANAFVEVLTFKLLRCLGAPTLTLASGPPQPARGKRPSL
jgi:hypothetical protein